MNEKLPEKNQQAIQKLDKQIAVTDAKVDRMLQDISEIKNNHLLHINDELRSMSATIATNQTNMTNLITNKIEEIYSKISELKINDAQQEPGNKLVNKVIEYVIIGVLAFALALLFDKK